MISKRETLETLARRWTALDVALRARGVVYSTLFVFYMSVIQPLILVRLIRSQKETQADWLLAALFIASQVGELVGYRLKWPMLKANMRRWPGNRDLGVGFLVINSITHLMLNSVLFFSMTPALGLTSNDFLPAMLKMGLFFLLLTKEGLFIGVFVTRVGGFPSPDNEANQQVEAWSDVIFGPDAEPEDLAAPTARLHEALGELLLLFYGAVVFTFSWDAIMLVMRPLDPSERFMGRLGFVLLFLFLYPPSRMVFVAENWFVHQSRFQRRLSLATFVVVLILAIRSVPVR